jgi:hypothetical protein
MRKATIANTSQAHRKATSQIPQESTHKSKWVMLENHIVILVMRYEQLKSMNHKFSKTPSITYIGQEGVDGSVLGLVR